MAARSLILCAWLAGLASGASAAGTVQVRWLDAERFSDIGRSAIDREHVLAALQEHLQSLGRKLPDGQVLQLSVTDVDLAGEQNPMRHEIRVLRGRADWPRMSLRFELREQGRVLKSGQADLADMNYLFGPPVSGDLAYEKRMIDRWFTAEFAPSLR
jgi:hypothetical protein